MAWLKRISNEYRSLAKSENEFNITPVDDTLEYWTAIMNGPEDTPYAGGKFQQVLRSRQLLDCFSLNPP